MLRNKDEPAKSLEVECSRFYSIKKAASPLFFFSSQALPLGCSLRQHLMMLKTRFRTQPVRHYEMYNKHTKL